MNFYDRFNELCKQKGVTMAKACTEMGMNPSITWRWKDTTPSNRTLQRLCAYFELTYNDILSDTPYQPKPEPPKPTQTGSLFELLEDEKTTNIMRIIMDATPECKHFLRVLLDAYEAG